MGDSYTEASKIPIDVVIRYIQMADIEQEISDMKEKTENG
jgi:hypothetical protein